MAGRYCGMAGRDWRLAGRYCGLASRDWRLAGRDWIMSGRDWRLAGRDWIMSGRDWIMSGRDWIMGGTDWRIMLQRLKNEWQRGEDWLKSELRLSTRVKLAGKGSCDPTPTLDLLAGQAPQQRSVSYVTATLPAVGTRAVPGVRTVVVMLPLQHREKLVYLQQVWRQVCSCNRGVETDV